LPQAANIGTIKTKARARAINLYHKLLLDMLNHLRLKYRHNNKGLAQSTPN
jgi:hypothetical protein